MECLSQIQMASMSPDVTIVVAPPPPPPPPPPQPPVAVPSATDVAALNHWCQLVLGWSCTTDATQWMQTMSAMYTLVMAPGISDELGLVMGEQFAVHVAQFGIEWPHRLPIILNLLTVAPLWTTVERPHGYHAPIDGDRPDKRTYQTLAILTMNTVDTAFGGQMPVDCANCSRRLKTAMGALTYTRRVVTVGKGTASEARYSLFAVSTACSAICAEQLTKRVSIRMPCFYV
jgi:hypothetical protein